MDSEIIYKVNKEDFKQALLEVISEEIKDSVYNRFESTIVDSKAACQILRVSPATLHRYVNSGHLQTEPRNKNDKYNFSLGYLLRQDSKIISRKIRYGFKPQL
jgi:hypothetical protein